jgi:hypothetical protein
MMPKMASERIHEMLEEENPAAITFDGLDAALIGVARQHGSPSVACYSRKKLVQHFVKALGSYEDAEEWMGFNVECLGVTDGTPVIVDDMALE